MNIHTISAQVIEILRMLIILFKIEDIFFVNTIVIIIKIVQIDIITVASYS